MSHSSNNVDLGHPEKTQDEVLEVIQYTPATAKVGRRPRPSGVRHQVFAITWRNRGPNSATGTSTNTALRSAKRPTLHWRSPGRLT
jgi:hypothetical protein